MSDKRPRLEPLLGHVEVHRSAHGWVKAVERGIPLWVQQPRVHARTRRRSGSAPSAVCHSVKTSLCSPWLREREADHGDNRGVHVHMTRLAALGRLQSVPLQRGTRRPLSPVPRAGNGDHPQGGSVRLGSRSKLGAGAEGPGYLVSMSVTKEDRLKAIARVVAGQARGVLKPSCDRGRLLRTPLRVSMVVKELP